MNITRILGKERGTYTLTLKTKKTNELKVLTFTINNKRAFKRHGVMLLTRPWNIVSKCGT